MSEEIKCKCGSTDCFIKKVGPHIGAYCKQCGKYIKWIKRPNIRLIEQIVEITDVLKSEPDDDIPPWEDN